MKLDLQNNSQNAADMSAFIMPSAWFDRFFVDEEDVKSDQQLVNEGNTNAIHKTMGTTDMESGSNEGNRNADSDLRDKQKFELNERKEKNKDIADIVAAEARTVMQDDLAKTQATYANGQFTMFGITVDEEDLNASIDEALADYNAYADRHNIPQEDRAAHYAFLLEMKHATPEEQASLMTERAQNSPEGAREVQGVMEDAKIISDRSNGFQARQDNAVTVANGDNAIENATMGEIVDQRAVTWQTQDNEVQTTALSRRGYADSEISDLGNRQAGGVDELSSLFGESASPTVQVATAEPTTPQHISSPVLGQG